MTSHAVHCAWRFTIVLVGICSIAAGIYLFRNWIEMFTRMRGKEMALSPSSPAYSGWKVSPLPLYFDIYLFNWTNPEDFYVGSGKKPRFEQLGPYRFRELPDKVDIDWHNQNYSVSFRKKAYFHFDATGSKGSLSDKITTVNTVSHSAALRVRDESFVTRFSINMGLKMYSQNHFETKTADEWLFTGYFHPLVTLGRAFMPGDVPYDRVGWMYTRNGSATFDGHFNVYTGADDISKMGQVHTWNGHTHTGAFEGACGNVFGSMGEFFPPNLSTNDSVSIFLPNLCRAVPLDYTETVTVHGITAYKFAGTERAVDNGTLYPETSCFCVNGKCEAAGVINIAPCKYNSSVYMSYPHFYKADPSYLEAIEGLQPDKQKHEFYMTLEPNAGVPMDVGGGFQANYLMEPVEGISAFENIPRTFIPIMWCEERVTVTEELAADIGLVPLIVLLGQIVTGILLAGGLICVCWYPTRLVAGICRGDDPKAKAALFTQLSFATGGAAAPSLWPATNERVGVRLLDYRRNSGVATRLAADDNDSSQNLALMGSQIIDLRASTDVIIR